MNRVSKNAPEGSSVYSLEDLKPNHCDKIPKGTVGIVQEHCSEDKIQVEFKLDDTAVTVKVAAEKVKKKIFTVLAIDGGGIRGLIPALILACIEQRMENLLGNRNEKCQLRIADVFDLIAGTSTGGIIALALTKPDHMGRPAYTAADLVDLYMGEGENIFNRSAMHRIYSGYGFLNKKYPADGIEDILERYFRDTTLDQAFTRVLIPTYDMRGTWVHWQNKFDCQRGGHPRFFKSYSIDDTPLESPLMRDVARATSAAPPILNLLTLTYSCLICSSLKPLLMAVSSQTIPQCVPMRMRNEYYEARADPMIKSSLFPSEQGILRVL